MTRFRYVSTARAVEMSPGDLITVAAELEAVLFDDPVLLRPHVVPLPQDGVIQVEGVVDSNPTDVAKGMVLDAADTTWAHALRHCKVQTEDRTSWLTPY